MSVAKFALFSCKRYETLLGPLVGATVCPLTPGIRTAWILYLIPTRGTDYFL